MTEEFTIREAAPDDAQAIAEVHIASWRTSYTDIFPPEVIENLDVKRRAKMWLESIEKRVNNIFLYVAENLEGQIVGFAGGGKQGQEPIKGYDGELRVMYILEEYQKQGIGSKLFEAVSKRMAAEGMNSMLAWVLVENPSRAFYEKKGGEVVSDRLYEKEGKFYSAVGYGWGDLETLLDNEE